MNYIDQLNQVGAIITEENFKAILNGFSDGIEEACAFEGKSYRTECIASLNNKGIKTLIEGQYYKNIRIFNLAKGVL